MDVETEQIVRDLRRRAVPGDPSYRAAQYIESAYQDYQSRLAAGSLQSVAGGDISNGLNSILRSTEAAQHHVMRQQVPEQDTTTRDMLTKETLALLRQEREHDLGNAEEKSDYEYIELMGIIFGGRFQYISRLLALTARYAGELPHDLIHPFTRQKIQTRLKQTEYATLTERVNEVQDVLTNTCIWQDLVDPGLAGNVRIACDHVSRLLPRLHGLNLNHVFAYVDNVTNDEDRQRFLDFFCAVTAFVWRNNSVMAAQPYKTKYEHEAVQKGLYDASMRLKDYCLSGNVIYYRPRQPPRSMQELHSRESPFV